MNPTNIIKESDLFSKIIVRKNTNSIKWDRDPKKDLIPMWVADMDFQTPIEIRKAFSERIEHGIFGYTFFPDTYYNSIIRWVQKQFNWKIEKDHIKYSPGIIVALNVCIQAYSQPGDKIIVQMPVYHVFFHSIENNGRQIVNNQLNFDEKQKTYFIDWEDLERKLNDSRVRMLIFCSPHNPTGRVWAKEELEKLCQLCEKYNVVLISDEIHSDLIFKPNKHIPTALINPNITVTLISPSKTFNLSGLSSSVIIIPNKQLNDKYSNTATNFGLFGGNVFGTIATEIAYTKCDYWLDKLLIYLENNIEYVKKYCEEKLNGLLKIIDHQATYLIWIDCKSLSMNPDELDKFFKEKANVWLNNGAEFGKGGEGFMRMNIAFPKSIIEEAMLKIEIALKNQNFL